MPFPLDPNQSAVRDAVLAPGGNLRVVAAAGSGKTATLVQTIAALVDQGVSPDLIVATTFTSKAGKEMKERLKGVMHWMQVERLRLGTFHGLALRSLREQDPVRWNMRRCVVVGQRDADVPHQKAIWQSILLYRQDGVWGSGVRSLDLGIRKREVGNYMLAVDVLRSQGLEQGSEGAERKIAELRLDHDLRSFRRAWELYEDAKQTLGCFDFADVLYAYYQGLLDGSVSDRGEYVFVDEAQDNSQLQLDIAQKLAEGARLILIGDGRQAIYSWRGAEPSIFLGADVTLQAATAPIPRNYRSASRIVDVSNETARGASWSLGSEAEAHRQDEGLVRILDAPTAALEASAVADEIAEAMKQGRSANDYAILCRTNTGAEAFEGALMMRRIPAVRIGGRPFWEGAQALDFLAYCMLGEYENWPSFERIYNVPALPKRYLGRAFVAKVQALVQTGMPIPAACRAVAPSLRGGSQKGALELAALLDTLRGLPWAKRVKRIATVLRPPEAPESGDDDAHLVVDVCAGIAAHFPNALELATYADACTKNTFSLAEGGQKTGQPRVTISTVHRSKGLEWPVVYVAASAGSFPHHRCMDPESFEEERRLFYVAVSRAKDELVVTSAQENPQGESAGPSPFTRDYVEPHCNPMEVPHQGTLFAPGASL